MIRSPRPQLVATDPADPLPLLAMPIATREQIDAALRVIHQHTTDEHEAADVAAMLGTGQA